MVSQTEIAQRVVESILAQKLAPGERLGEQELADLFGVSRTLVREALGRLSARGMVEVNARRGWYVVQPSREEARDAFTARLAIETGLVRTLGAPLDAPALARLERHVEDERAAIARGDPGERSYLLGEFHVCLAECSGHALLAEILKDLTARTTLIATLYQSTHDASRSCDEHAEIVAALRAGDHALAEARVRAHIGEVADHLQDGAGRDPLDGLRSALLPAARASTPRPRRRLFSSLLAEPPATTAATPAAASTVASGAPSPAVPPQES
jgi:DNA-binding GntR family transcriptional regulator